MNIFHNLEKSVKFWAAYKEVNYWQVPDEQILAADEKPEGNWWGPFHCRDCAVSCAHLGMTTRQAYALWHGLPDEIFCATLDVS
jgi:hypothetical protein